MCVLIRFAIVYRSATARPCSGKHFDQCQMAGFITLQPWLGGEDCQSELNLLLLYYITLTRSALI